MGIEICLIVGYVTAQLAMSL